MSSVQQNPAHCPTQFINMILQFLFGSGKENFEFSAPNILFIKQFQRNRTTTAITLLSQLMLRLQIFPCPRCSQLLQLLQFLGRAQLLQHFIIVIIGILVSVIIAATLSIIPSITIILYCGNHNICDHNNHCKDGNFYQIQYINAHFT